MASQNSKEAITRQNLAFIYGRKKGADELLPDPDKVAYLRSGLRSSESNIFDADSVIFDFSGDHAALAPAFPSPTRLLPSEAIFPSFEHALQASKCVDLSQHVSTIQSFVDIRDLKRYLVKLKRSDPMAIQQDWNERCLTIGVNLLRDKFLRSRSARQTLMGTGHKRLLYCNEHNDLFWGVNRCGDGSNHLGCLLEQVRREILQGEDIVCWLRSCLPLAPPQEARFELSVVGEDGKEVFDQLVVDEENVIVLGRSLIEHESVSRRHAALVLDAKLNPYIIDLGSTHGTFLDQIKLNAFVWTSLFGKKEGEATIRLAASPRVVHVRIIHNAKLIREQEIKEKVERDQSKKEKEEESRRTVFVAGLSEGSSRELEDEKLLRSFFAPCGAIGTISIPRDRNGLSRGIAFVSFERVEAVLQALGRDGDLLGGRPIRVRRSAASVSSSTASSHSMRQGRNLDQNLKVNSSGFREADGEKRHAGDYGDKRHRSRDRDRSGSRERNKNRRF
eukprot:gene4260-4679_t